MSYQLFSNEWVEQFSSEVKKGPSLERRQAVDDHYWQWIETCKEKMDIRLALVLTEQNHLDRYAYFDLKKGEVADSHLGTEEERGTADFILGGSKDDWFEIIKGKREITQNLMYRKLRLLQGNLHGYFRGIYFFVEFLRAGTRVPTAFEATQNLT
ncbi:putative sterol carrier protein [Scopulibacillus daqui]|uniref:Sterol carrier protein n=1 Tax=Scopulibacillus daqui TaxID=1469162 RepID=A0ABS2Q007_9BACL|nr:SCP2 sterol-binding domain-containing protein [Scopulibacillus daqui]MBM7645618.1 putative sterol carrier protein [Scopulibacillus daqui]